MFVWYSQPSEDPHYATSMLLISLGNFNFSLLTYHYLEIFIQVICKKKFNLFFPISLLVEIRFNNNDNLPASGQNRQKSIC